MTAAHETQRLYGITVDGTVLATTQMDGPVVTADLAIADAINSFDGSHVSGRIEVVIAAQDPNHGVDLRAIQPGARIQAFVSYPIIDVTNHTIVAGATPYQASLVELR